MSIGWPALACAFSVHAGLGSRPDGYAVLRSPRVMSGWARVIPSSGTALQRDHDKGIGPIKMIGTEGTYIHNQYGDRSPSSSDCYKIAT